MWKKLGLFTLLAGTPGGCSGGYGHEGHGSRYRAAYYTPRPCHRGGWHRGWSRW